jgi:hypothetical protein
MNGPHQVGGADFGDWFGDQIDLGGQTSIEIKCLCIGDGGDKLRSGVVLQGEQEGAFQDSWRTNAWGHFDWR